MNRADRQKILIEGAKKEGKVSLYTTLIVDQVVRPVKEAFEKEYPFLQVEFFRGNSERLVQKMMAEYQAKRYEVDIIDGTVSPTMVRRANLLQRFHSPMLGRISRRAERCPGLLGFDESLFFRHRLQYADDQTSRSAEDLRRSSEPALERADDVVDEPRLGRADIHGHDSQHHGSGSRQGLFAETANAEYRQDDREQPASLGFDDRRRVSAGAADFQPPCVYQQTAGAPVDWIPHEPVTATIQTIALAKNSPHPHAAMLFIDFATSEKGQKVFQQSNYLPSHPKVPAKQADLKPGGGRFKRAYYINPDAQYDKGNEWVDYFNNVFVK